ncbi:MAG TPA: hypothetical protein DCM45_06880 [Clostridiales bacterium]|nr:hypothetical protein [Clostridiales bacterium]
MLIILMTFSVLAGCGQNGGQTAGEAETFSWWLYGSEDSSYYPTYQENPVVQYMLSKAYGPDKKKLALEFTSPVTGTEQDSFNTMLATGDYTDVMDLTAYTGSIVDLYQEGIILDLTEYVEKYMPNYKALVEANPVIAQAAITLIDGEKKYLQVIGTGDPAEINWCGYAYRRDWIVKYGTNPKDGSAFSGSYQATLPDGSPNKDSWVDNVVFPSGGSDPVYISDWEWMFEIFTRAMAEQNITDGYCLSIPYSGFVSMGDLVCAFGGGAPQWYKNKSDQIVFGGTSDDFQVYLQAMSTWYKNGWMDQAFTERSADIFYRIDDTKVRQGKVGLWLGLHSQLMGRLDNGEGYAKDSIVFSARQPINDIYGSAAQQNVEPYAYYSISRIGQAVAISSKAKDKDLAALCSFIDFLYTEEGGVMKMMGLNKQQYEESKSEFYTKYGLTEGAHYRLPDSEVKDGKIYSYVDKIVADTGTLKQASTAVKLKPGYDFVSLRRESGSDQLMANYKQWVVYTNDGYLDQPFIRQLSPDNMKTQSKTMNNVNEFMSKNVPLFIKGDKDPFNAEDWQSFVKALNKYNPAKVTAMYQELLDNLNK